MALPYTINKLYSRTTPESEDQDNVTFESGRIDGEEETMPSKQLTEILTHTKPTEPQSAPPSLSIRPKFKNYNDSVKSESDAVRSAPPETSASNRQTGNDRLRISNGDSMESFHTAPISLEDLAGKKDPEIFIDRIP